MTGFVEAVRNNHEKNISYTKRKKKEVGGYTYLDSMFLILYVSQTPRNMTAIFGRKINS